MVSIINYFIILFNKLILFNYKEIKKQKNFNIEKKTSRNRLKMTLKE